MNIKSTDLVSLFEEALIGKEQRSLDEIGIVIQMGDGICKDHGLKHAVYNELVEFEHGNQGIILDLDEGFVSVFVLHRHIAVKEREIVKRTGSVFKINVGMHLLGRVINVLSKPIDGLGPLHTTELWPIEAF